MTVVDQPYLHKKGLMVFLVLMNMFIPLSTDMYLPALPIMSKQLSASASVLNLTLSMFFLFYAAGILVWGPLSDKYGRRRSLLIGSMLYTISALACALAPGVWLIIPARIMQGIGAGAITSSALAIVKDCYTGAAKTKIIALMQSMGGLAPMLAPILGALILTLAGWRITFVVLAVIGVVCFLLTVLYKETLPEDERVRGGLSESFYRMSQVARNKGFLYPLLIFALFNFAFMGYIAVSSYIYQDFFGMPAQGYSLFFSANALLSLLGPLVYIKYFTNANKHVFTSVCFAISSFAGLVLLLLGRVSPFAFLICFIPFSMVGTTVRPFSTDLLLDQQQGDTGSASALINFACTLFGCFGMTIVSASPWNLILTLGGIILGASLAQFVFWRLLIKSSIRCIGVKE
jgi:DHA1 family bicyclomycin/chloramphenicol resistance-like MFS transporter